MTAFFVDASALSWIVKSAGNVILVSDLVSVEMFSTFARLQCSTTISQNDARTLQASLITDLVREYLSILMDAATLTIARHVLRTLDAIQLACAIVGSTTLGVKVTFVSGDNRLLVAATAEGFATDNPYLHP